LDKRKPGQKNQVLFKISSKVGFTNPRYEFEIPSFEIENPRILGGFLETELGFLICVELGVKNATLM
jgi:hypothetical protein